MALPNKCPLCFASSAEQFVVSRHVYGDSTGSRAFFHCRACDVRYQYPGLNAEEEAKFYANEFEGFMNNRTGNTKDWLEIERHLEFNESTRLRRMQYLAPYLNKSSNILEIGCSSGFMLYPLIKDGHKCTGIEPSNIFSKYLSTRSIPVFPDINELRANKPEQKFDLILHFFVLEHISDPRSFLKEQMAMLNAGGRIIFEIPNASDALFTVYDIPAFERFYWSIAHPWYFNPQSIKFLLDDMKFPYELLFDQRYDLSNHMVWARDGKQGGMGKFTSLLGKDIENLYKQSLIKSGHCDTMVGVITKF